jgi:hypothetical protein
MEEAKSIFGIIDNLSHKIDDNEIQCQNTSTYPILLQHSFECEANSLSRRRKILGSIPDIIV